MSADETRIARELKLNRDNAAREYSGDIDYRSRKDRIEQMKRAQREQKQARKHRRVG